MGQPIKHTFHPSLPPPDPNSVGVRAYQNWAQAKRDWEDREEKRRFAEERYANRQPESAEDFRQAEKADQERERRRAILRAEEARQSREQARNVRARADKAERQRGEANRQYIAYWNAYASSNHADQLKALFAYAVATGLADGYSGAGFASQESVDRTVRALNDINQSPREFVTRCKEIRGFKHEPEPPTPEQRLATARQQLLGV